MAMSGSPLPEREGDSYFRIRFMVRSMCSPGSGSPSRSLLWIEPESYRAPLPSVPIVELVRGWNLACDVHDHGLALPALDQLLLAEISPQELFDKLHAAVFEKLRVGFQATVEGHRTHYVTPPQSGKPRKWPPDTCGMVFEKLILGTCG